MSDILGPEAAKRVRWRMQRADMYEISLTEVDCLIATIDALAEALRAAQPGIDDFWIESAYSEDYQKARARVAAWLEENNGN